MPMLNKVARLIEENNYNSIHYKKWNIKFRDEFFKEVYWAYFPITEKYYFEGNPAFIYEFRDMFDMGRYPITLIRDGFSGVLDFFLLHPKPPYDFKSVLLLHTRMQKIVPPAWKNNVAFYKVQGSSTDTPTKEKLIVHGLSTEEYFWEGLSPIELAKRLKETTKDYRDVTFLIPQRESLISTWEKRNERYDIMFYKALYKVFGFDVKIEMNINEYLKDFKAVGDFSFYNMDESLGLIADNYIDHYFFWKGGNSLNKNHQREDKKKSLKYKLSPYHDLHIFTHSNIGEDFLKYYLPYRNSGKQISLYSIYQNEVVRKIYLGD